MLGSFPKVSPYTRLQQAIPRNQRKRSLHRKGVCACYVSKSFLTLCGESPPGSSVRGILQARIVEWVVMPSSRGPSQTQGSNPHLLCLLQWQEFFTTSATWKPIGEDTRLHRSQSLGLEKNLRGSWVDRTWGLVRNAGEIRLHWGPTQAVSAFNQEPLIKCSSTTSLTYRQLPEYLSLCKRAIP